MHIMLKYFFYAALCLVCATTTHCTKTSTISPDSLPPETQTGAGTFACKINGVVWQWKDPAPQWLDTRPRTVFRYDPNRWGGFLEIDGWNYSDGKTAANLLTLGVDSLPLFKEKIINPNFGVSYIIKYSNFLNAKGQCQDFSSAGVLDTSKQFFSSGKLIISRFDQSAKIVSGTFNCTIYQFGCGDTLKITDGRFDVKY